jgi:carbamoyl-phosphate synthase large subunit
MGIDYIPGMSYLKSQIAAGSNLPEAGSVFLSVRDEDKDAVIPLAKDLIALGFKIYATRSTSTKLMDSGIKSLALFKISDGRPNALDLILSHELSWIINTPSSGPVPKVDEIQMRAEATSRGIPITTTINGVRAAIEGLKALRELRIMEVCSLQEYHRHSTKLNV